MIHAKLERFQFTHPGPLAASLIRPFRYRRYCNLSTLQKTRDSQCAWCNVHEVLGKSRKYCSDSCRESAHMFCTPQSPASKAFVFVMLQGCTCTYCGEIFDDELRDLIEKRWCTFREWAGGRYAAQTEPVTLFQLGYAIGSKWHCDHVIPISRGGDGIGFDNVQVICAGCHRKKTSREAMGLPGKRSVPVASG